MSGTILIVEDNEKNRVLFRDILRFHGYEVVEAENGAVAVEMAREHRPDLILMDVQMPVMDGIAAAKILRSDPATKDIPLIALTSFAMKGDRERFLAAGFTDYLAKPIDTRTLPDTVKRLIKKASA